MQTHAATQDVRRVVLAVTISSFSIAALMGIAALASSTGFGESSLRILATTLVVGCASVATLCCLVVVGKRAQPLGVAGFVVALATAALALVLVWSPSGELGEHLGKPLGVAVTASATLAQICLLLGLAGARRRIAGLMWATVACAGVVAIMVGTVVCGYDQGDGYYRWLGIAAILDVLGTVVTIALAVFGRDERTLTVTLPPALASHVRQEAQRTGRPVEQLVNEALTRFLGAPV